MKAIIAAGGRGTRVRPLTWTRNKHLIPLANKPMIVHAIEKVKTAGITDIILNINPGDTELSSVLGDGSQFGVKLTYLEQQGGALGIAHVVYNAKSFLQDDAFLFYLGENIILGSLQRFVQRFYEEHLHCMIALSRVKDPERFGVPQFSQDGVLECVVEKPKNPPSPFAVTGIYLFDKDFFTYFPDMKPSARGEYEITDIITRYIQEPEKKVGYEEITGWWKDTGNFEALLEGNMLLLDELPYGAFQSQAEIHPDAQIQGRVQIGKGTVIGRDVSIRGPVIIGENCRLETSRIGSYTSIGNKVNIKESDIQQTIVFDEVTIDQVNGIHDSIIGHRAVLSAHRQKRGPRMIIGDNSIVEL